MNKKIIKKIAILFLFLLAPLYAKIQYLFSHGLADTYKQAYQYAKTYKIGGKVYHNKHYIIDNPFSFNYPDARKGILRVNPLKTSLSQNNEIAHLKLKVEEIARKKKIGNGEIVIFGISRGASTAFNFMALHNHHAVKALILESPFDAMASIIDNKRKRWHLEWLSPDFGQFLLESIFWKYKRNGIRPIDLAGAIRKDLPILIICSKEDQLVPYQSSVKLYKKLKESGHQAVHLFIADHGKHAKIWPGKDSNKYQKAVHSFYAKYDLPYDSMLALEGEKYLYSG